jgi:hypothetical protein
MQATFKNRKKIAAKSPRSVLKKKNRIEEGGALGSRVKKEQESTKPRA